ncbi:MAG: aldo/keto reductase [Anaerolineae bacterium]|nr:aldo/keto reductase [Anaerolineae bacterium]
MKYRKFGNLDFEVSALGFGAMRLPIIDGNGAAIDEAEATKMLHYAIDRGVNYVDTAYPYHDGNSERFLGRALKNGYRQRVKLVTKMPSWKIEGPQDFDQYFDEQLERLQTDYVDFYLLHSLNSDWWAKLRDFGVLAWAEKAIAAGRIGRLGFSFHDSYEVFKEIVDAYDDWGLCQIQYNYMDVENQAGLKGLQYAAEKGLAVVIMEPLLGGKLVNPPQPIQKIWDTAANKRSAADWALQWLWSQPEVAVVLSGMSAMSQVEENLASADVSEIGALTREELALFEQVSQKYSELSAIPCTQCNYCMPCPNDVNIPWNFNIYNSGLMYDKPDSARGQYAWLAESYRLGISDTNQQAGGCIQCGECEAKCPQGIPISEWMQIVHQVLGEGQPFVSRLA